MRTMQEKNQPSVETADLEAAAYLYSRDHPLLSHHYDGRRTIFTFQASPQDLTDFYNSPGERSRRLLLARRTLLGLCHEGRR